MNKLVVIFKDGHKREFEPEEWTSFKWLEKRLDIFCGFKNIAVYNLDSVVGVEQIEEEQADASSAN